MESSDFSPASKCMRSLTETLIAVNDILQGFDGFFALKNLNGEYFFVNGQLAQSAGRVVGDMIGKTDRELWPETVAEEILKQDRLVLNGNAPFVEYSNRFELNGVQHDYHVIKCVIRFASGEPFCICNISSPLAGADKLRTVHDKVVTIFTLPAGA